MILQKEKTLFVSDLDGTLLTPEATLADGDAARLNALGRRGVRITYATARTVESAGKILGEIAFGPDSPPVSLMNGVLCRDMAAERYVDRACFSAECAREILHGMTEAGADPFVYTLIGGERLMTHYRTIRNPAMQHFMEERKMRYGKPFRKIESLADVEGDVIYFCLVGSESDVRCASHATDHVTGIRRACYRDTYAPDTWYLELFDQNASKKHAIEFLRTWTGASYVVCFGDNQNDLPMFEAADFAVAAPNAVPELKAAADDVARDGVTAYIEAFAEKQGW